MEILGEAYFLNLSLVAIGFASVSAVVMLLRQMMGGTLSKFDIHLIMCYLTGAFSTAFAAVLPVFVAMASEDPLVVWGVSGAIAAALIGAHLVSMILRRRRITGSAAPMTIIADWVVQGLAVAALLVNIGWPRVGWLYAGAVTLVLGLVMFAFLRRLGSLLTGGESIHDWNPGQG